jgi:hypothetical protein
MHDAAVFGVGGFGDAEFVVVVGYGDVPGVVDLSAAGGVEGGAVENEGWTWGFDYLVYFGVEVIEKGILVVEAVGHGLVVRISCLGAVIKFLDSEIKIFTTGGTGVHRVKTNAGRKLASIQYTVTLVILLFLLSMVVFNVCD